MMPSTTSRSASTLVEAVEVMMTVRRSAIGGSNEVNEGLPGRQDSRESLSTSSRLSLGGCIYVRASELLGGRTQRLQLRKYSFTETRGAGSGCEHVKRRKYVELEGGCHS